jgi:hypothetical protein
MVRKVEVLFALQQLSISVRVFLTYPARIFPALVRRGFMHRGCCAGQREPRDGPLVHDDIGGRTALSLAAFKDCGPQTDPVSVTVRVAKRDFACGDSSKVIVDMCTQTYPFAGEVASDITEDREEAHSASICDAVDSATSGRVTVEQVGDDEDEIIPYILPKMEENRAKVSAKPLYHKLFTVMFNG